MGPQLTVSRRRKILFAAIAEVLVIVAAFVVFALGSDADLLRARRVLTFFLIVQALACAFAPLWTAERAARGTYWKALRAALEPVGWTLAVMLSGPLLLALFYDRGALLAWLLAELVCAGAGLASAGLLLALARLTRRPLLAAGLAAALLLLFELQPAYTLRVIRSARGHPGVQRLLINLGLRPSWMGVAHALKRARPGVWHYDLGSTTLYPPHWIGTDYAASPPEPWDHFMEHLVAAVILAGLAALRRTSGDKAADTYHEACPPWRAHEEHEAERLSPDAKSSGESDSPS
jgi:hypothetical protein